MWATDIFCKCVVFMSMEKNKLTLFLGRHETRSAGIWVYGTELLNALCVLTQERKELLDLIFPLEVVFAGSEEQEKELELVRLKYADLEIRIKRLQDFANHRKLGIFFDFFRKFNDTKILHATSNIMPILGSAKKILTIHDLFQAYPVSNSEGSYGVFKALVYKFLFFLQFKRSDFIVTDLIEGNDNLKRIYPKLNNICTISPGLKSVFIESNLPDKENKQPVLVAFASQDARKNIRRVIDAFCETNFFEDIKLKIIASSSELKKQLDYFILNNSISNIEVLTNVPDKEMPMIYSQSRALIFPSLAEGFGFPIYEALSQGIPVVVSANLVIEDIRMEVRPFVIECDPKSQDSIQNAMLRASGAVQRVEKRQKVASYIRNILNFKNTARQFLDLYKTF